MRDFALETYFSKWEFAAKYHMTASDIESMSLTDLLKLASSEDRDNFENLWLGYTQTFGSPQLREQISKTYETAEPSDIICFAGAEEGIYCLNRILLSKQDHVITIVPNYQAAETLPLQVCEVTGVPLDADKNWFLDVDRIKAAIRSNTKLISINFPNNPTGSVIDRSTFDALIELSRKHGIYIFSDEVYRLVEREESLRLPQVADVYENGLSLNVMSKAYGFPGLRIGWIMSKNTELLSKMERYKHYLSICNSAPSEQLAIIALKAKETILTKNRQLLNSNVQKLNAFFNQFSDLFDWLPPDGGCVAFPKYSGPGNADDFCEKLVEQTGVLFLPPKIYRSQLLDTPDDRFRVGFGRKNIDQGLNVLQAYLNKHY